MRPRTILILVILAALIILGIVITRSRTTDPDDTGNTATNTETNTADTSPNTDTNTTTGSTTNTTVNQNGTGSSPSPTAGTLKYDDAIALYAGKLFQFQNCIAGPPPVISPGSLSIKKGAKYMLDNRDKTAHTIKVSTQSYRLPAQSFVIATAPAKIGTYTITCDGGGAAQLQVQP